MKIGINCKSKHTFHDSVKLVQQLFHSYKTWHYFGELPSLTTIKLSCFRHMKTVQTRLKNHTLNVWQHYSITVTNKRWFEVCFCWSLLVHRSIHIYIHTSMCEWCMHEGWLHQRAFLINTGLVILQKLNLFFIDCSSSFSRKGQKTRKQSLWPHNTLLLLAVESVWMEQVVVNAQTVQPSRVGPELSGSSRYGSYGPESCRESLMVPQFTTPRAYVIIVVGGAT